MQLDIPTLPLDFLPCVTIEVLISLMLTHVFFASFLKNGKETQALENARCDSPWTTQDKACMCYPSANFCIFINKNL